mgnify:CR=1 FL=1
MSTLAIHGGAPVRARNDWPRWPQYDDDTERALVGALRSRRWSVTWHSATGGKSRERSFAESFAAYNDAAFCVSVDHGSSALVIALEALGVGPGDEVVVPAMTWVAPATAVLRVGALPVLADVDPASGCLTAATIHKVISPSTKAVIAVHLACTVASIDEITEVTAQRGVALIEDCSQAHGARWQGKSVGTFGAVGVFSLGAAKPLAGGEAGAAITDDESLYRRMLMLRADSRGYADQPPGPYEHELAEHAEIMGANYCMSELTAALLLDQLPRLDDQHIHREQRAKELHAALSVMPGLSVVPVPQQVDRRAIYEYGIQFRPGTFGSTPIDRVAAAVTAELNTNVYPPRVPLHRSPLLRPHTKQRFARLWSEGAARARGRTYPGADHYRDHTLLLHHSALLGDPHDITDVVAAFEKVLTNRSSLG